MKPCLVDVNVLLALLVQHHDHHDLALHWFRALDAGTAGICRVVQLSTIRLLGNRTIMGEFALSAGAAWTTLQDLCEDERIEFVHEPGEFETAFSRLLRYPCPTPKLIADVYLAAFAIASGRSVVTLDRGFRQFAGLEVQLPGL